MTDTGEGTSNTVDAFKDRLSQRARDTTRPALAHQTQGRGLTATEQDLADAMMQIMGSGAQDFSAVAKALRQRAVQAPVTGRVDWDLDLLQAELAALNADLDVAYAEHGYGA